MAGKKTVSMQDIADELGISKVTVSKALNGKDGVGEELKQKISRVRRNMAIYFPIMDSAGQKSGNCYERPL